jgi:ribulose-phosphate 3-epimerase
MIKLSPSILSADFANLERDIHKAELAGADYIHVDVMDGHFVPNITIGVPVVKSLRKATSLPLDVHLMISDPDDYIEAFIQAGADILTVHAEANGDTLAQIRRIRALGARPSVSIKPGTPIETVLPLLPELSMLLVMTVEPGFGGQGFIDDTIPKIRALRKAINEGGYDCELEADGGIGAKNIRAVCEYGINVVVAGSAVFGQPDVGEAIAALRRNTEGL